MEKLPTQDEVKEKARLLYELLSDPHPGLMTWCEARYRLLVELEKMLHEVVSAMDR